MLSIFWNLSLSSCSMAKSFKTNYVLADPASNSAWQLLCSWDFSITNERAVRQRKNNLRVQLKVNITVLKPLLSIKTKSGKREAFHRTILPTLHEIPYI